MKSLGRINLAPGAQEKGFSLMEVLVTMAVVAFGLLGLASLMLKGLQANSSSNLRSIAVNQAYDMVDRMRSNSAGLYAGNYDTVLPSGSSTSCSDGVISTSHVIPPASTPDCSACSSASCTVAEVATRDACQWHQQNKRLLPNGAAAVCKSSSNNWYTVYVSWDEGKSGSTNRTFSLRVEP